MPPILNAPRRSPARQQFALRQQSRYSANSVASSPNTAYQAAMFRYFDMTDHARLPQRFSRENRSVLARLR